LIDGQGLLQKEIVVASPDDEVTVHIPSGTKMLDEDGNPLNEIYAVSTQPPAALPEDCHLLNAFDFSPDGATFDPGMEIVIFFDPSEIPEDRIVVLAFFNENKGGWEFVEGVVKPGGIATFTITHFSVYALMYQKDKGLSTNELIAIGITAALAAALIVTLIISQIRSRSPSSRYAERRRKAVEADRQRTDRTR
jgi:hypothetical protein